MADENTQPTNPSATPVEQPVTVTAQPAAAEPTPTPVVQAEPTPVVATPAAATPTPEVIPTLVTNTCTCPEIKVEDWDKKKVTLHKTFYKTFSTRALGFHFSDAIDKNRGMIEIKVKDFKAVTNPMILDTNSLFLSTLFIEIENTDVKDPKVVKFDKEFYCKVSKNTSRKDLQKDLIFLEQEMGKKPTQVYFWFVTCAKCDAKKEIKTVIMAA